MHSPGTQMGPYEILSVLGAGGMGEVYRARDPRIGRDVAIKIIPDSLAADTERLGRFEQEMRAAGALNHPNILAIYDVGNHAGSPYLVSELLHGDTLRSLLDAGPLPFKKVSDFALQISRGLAAAHERGIIHRDLKPENLFVTKDGRVKILDFGLAKLTRPEEAGGRQSNISTTPGTESGIVLGTVGYMSPEQVRGERADHRSDIFALGAILYEMVSGRRAFEGPTAVEKMNSILKEDPPPLTESSRNISPALQRIISFCLEKKPEDRFQSARDLELALSAFSESSGKAATAPVAIGKSGRSLPRVGVIALAALIIAFLAFMVGKQAGTRHETAQPKQTASGFPVFHQVTFRRGGIISARFASDGQTIVYTANWNGTPEIFFTRLGNPESRSLGLPNAELYSLSSSGQMAVNFEITSLGPPTLAEVSISGGSPRQILEKVDYADCSPDGKGLAIVRRVGGKIRLEFPIGKVLYESENEVSWPRFSPDGNLIAFLEAQYTFGALSVVDLHGKKRVIKNGIQRWNNGLAWSPAGNEIWFVSSPQEGNGRSINVVSLSGQSREVFRMDGFLRILDISRTGQILISHGRLRNGIYCLPSVEKKELDLSWFDRPMVKDLSADGKTVLFDETGDGGGTDSSTYVRRTDAAEPVRLGDGQAYGLSPDGKWVTSNLKDSEVILLPTGPGQQRSLPNSKKIVYNVSSWFPDGKRIALVGAEPGHASRIYVQDVNSGDPNPITAEGVRVGLYSSTVPISPDSKFVLGLAASDRWSLYPVGGGQPHGVGELESIDTPIQWGEDNSSIFFYHPREFPARIYRLDLATGRKELWKQLNPPDPAGIRDVYPIVARDGKSYAYTYFRFISDLYVVDGLK